MGKLLEMVVVKDNACVFEANTTFAATTEETAELAAALTVVRKWERKAENATNLSLSQGEVTEFGYIIEKTFVTVSVKTSSIG